MNHQNPTYLKRRSGIYYFTRRIPSELQRQYKRNRIYVSLKTRSQRKAMAASERISHELEASWARAHAENVVQKLIPDEFKKSIKTESSILLGADDKLAVLPKLSEAGEMYLDLKGRDRSVNFESSVLRSLRYLIDILGDKPIDKYLRHDALQLRDTFLKRNLSVSSIKRNFNNINAVIGLVARELASPEPNTFRGLFFQEPLEQTKRSTIPIKQVKVLQAECSKADDEARWLLALISDTGMRLSEAVGLKKEDIILTDDISHISIIPHPWRRLKTIESKRKVPLIGASLWGVKRSFIELDGDFLFPSFCDGQVMKSNSVSARLNKWLKLRIGNEYVIHSLRHSFRDRLRSIDCPNEIIDSLGGWSRKSIGQSYGNGYDLKSLNRWISLINVFE